MMNQPPKPFSHRHKCSEVIPAPNVPCAFVGVFWPPVTLPVGWETGHIPPVPGTVRGSLRQSLAGLSIAVDLTTPKTS